MTAQMAVSIAGRPQSFAADGAVDRFIAIGSEQSRC